MTNQKRKKAKWQHELTKHRSSPSTAPKNPAQPGKIRVKRHRSSATVESTPLEDDDETQHYSLQTTFGNLVPKTEESQENPPSRGSTPTKIGTFTSGNTSAQKALELESHDKPVVSFKREIVTDVHNASDAPSASPTRCPSDARQPTMHQSRPTTSSAEESKPAISASMDVDTRCKPSGASERQAASHRPPGVPMAEISESRNAVSMDNDDASQSCATGGEASSMDCTSQIAKEKEPTPIAVVFSIGDDGNDALQQSTTAWNTIVSEARDTAPTLFHFRALQNLFSAQESLRDCPWPGKEGTLEGDSTVWRTQARSFNLHVWGYIRQFFTCANMDDFCFANSFANAVAQADVIDKYLETVDHDHAEVLDAPAANVFLGAKDLVDARFCRWKERDIHGSTLPLTPRSRADGRVRIVSARSDGTASRAPEDCAFTFVLLDSGASPAPVVGTSGCPWRVVLVVNEPRMLARLHERIQGGGTPQHADNILHLGTTPLAAAVRLWVRVRLQRQNSSGQHHEFQAVCVIPCTMGFGEVVKCVRLLALEQYPEALGTGAAVVFDHNTAAEGSQIWAALQSEMRTAPVDTTERMFGEKYTFVYTYTATAPTPPLEYVVPTQRPTHTVYPAQAYNSTCLLQTVMCSLFPDLLAKSVPKPQAHPTDAPTELMKLETSTREAVQQAASARFSGGVICVTFTPSIASLHAQTEKRLKQDHVTLLNWGCCSKNKPVLTYDQTEECTFNELLEKMRHERKVLFVVIADECHAGAALGTGAMDRFINNKEMLALSNVIVVAVSSTPYNAITKDSRIPVCNRVIWNNNRVAAGANDSAIHTAKTYVGLHHYMDSLSHAFPGAHHVRRDVRFAALNAFLTVVQEHNSSPTCTCDDLLAIDYGVAMTTVELLKAEHPVVEKVAKEVTEIMSKYTAVMGQEMTRAWNVYQMFTVISDDVRKELNKTKDLSLDTVMHAVRSTLKKTINLANLKAMPHDTFMVNAIVKKIKAKRILGEYMHSHLSSMESNNGQLLSGVDVDDVALDWFNATWHWTETDRIVESVVDRLPTGRFVHIVRMHAQDAATVARFSILLRAIRGHFFSCAQYEICLDNNIRRASQCIEFTAPFVARLQQQSVADGNHELSATLGDITFPCLVVQNGGKRMGSTLCRNFGGVDLRLLHTLPTDGTARTGTYLSTCLRELGIVASWRSPEEFLPTMEGARNFSPRCAEERKEVAPMVTLGLPLYGDVVRGVENGHCHRCFYAFCTWWKRRMDTATGVTGVFKKPENVTKSAFKRLMAELVARKAITVRSEINMKCDTLHIDKVDVNLLQSYDFQEDCRFEQVVELDMDEYTTMSTRNALTRRVVGAASAFTSSCDFGRAKLPPLCLPNNEIRAIHDEVLYVHADKQTLAAQLGCTTADFNGLLHGLPVSVLQGNSAPSTDYNARLVTLHARPHGHSSAHNGDILLGLALYTDVLELVDAAAGTFMGQKVVSVHMPQQYHAQRFLLHGPLQAGKTGAYFHFVELMQQFLKGTTLLSPAESERLFSIQNNKFRQHFDGAPVGLPYWLDGQKSLKEHIQIGAKMLPDKTAYHPQEASFRLRLLGRACSATAHRMKDGWEWLGVYKRLLIEHEHADWVPDRIDLINRVLETTSALLEFLPTKVSWDLSSGAIGIHTDASSALLMEAIDHEVLNLDQRFGANDSSAGFKVVKKCETSSQGSELQWYTTKETWNTPPTETGTQPPCTTVWDPSPLCNRSLAAATLLLGALHDPLHDGCVYTLGQDVQKRLVGLAACGVMRALDEVGMWIPERLKTTLSQHEQASKCIHSGVRKLEEFPVFVISGGPGRSTRAFLDWPDFAHTRATTLRCLVVPTNEFHEYRRLWGHEYAILEMPQAIGKTVNATMIDGHDGAFARLFIQLFAAAAGWTWVWMVDDNVHHTQLLDMRSDAGADERPGEPSSAFLNTCAMADAMSAVEHVIASTSTKLCTPGLQSHYTPMSSPLYDKKLPDAGPSQLRKVRTVLDVCGNVTRHAAIIGLSDDVRGCLSAVANDPESATPFAYTPQIQSMFLLNVKETTNRDIYFPPRLPYGVADFAKACCSKGLAVIKCNTVFHHAPDLQEVLRNPTVHHVKVEVNVSAFERPLVVALDTVGDSVDNAAVYAAVRDLLQVHGVDSSTVRLFHSKECSDGVNPSGQTNVANLKTLFGRCLFRVSCELRHLSISQNTTDAISIPAAALADCQLIDNSIQESQRFSQGAFLTHAAESDERLCSELGSMCRAVNSLPAPICYFGVSTDRLPAFQLALYYAGNLCKGHQHFVEKVWCTAQPNDMGSEATCIPQGSGIIVLLSVIPDTDPPGKSVPLHSLAPNVATDVGASASHEERSMSPSTPSTPSTPPLESELVASIDDTSARAQTKKRKRKSISPAMSDDGKSKVADEGDMRARDNRVGEDGTKRIRVVAGGLEDASSSDGKGIVGTAEQQTIKKLVSDAESAVVVGMPLDGGSAMATPPSNSTVSTGPGTVEMSPTITHSGGQHSFSKQTNMNHTIQEAPPSRQTLGKRTASATPPQSLASTDMHDSRPLEFMMLPERRQQKTTPAADNEEKDFHSEPLLQYGHGELGTDDEMDSQEPRFSLEEEVEAVPDSCPVEPF
eukprot:m.33047 g.33047  ORF g.33047 m.33047 type:complete len:2621 (-) comp14199_c0_seq1:362-8224(-)